MLTEINRDRRRFISLTALIAFSSLPWGILRSSVIPLPCEADLPSLEGATAWLNSPPLSGGDLRGKVALVGFWTYSCINWRRTLPFLRTWAKKYKEYGRLPISRTRSSFSDGGSQPRGFIFAFASFWMGSLLQLRTALMLIKMALGNAREPRLYQLIRQAAPIADRRFEIEFLDSGIEAYSFTFG